jgi:TrmH family RNA methyltransferase
VERITSRQNSIVKRIRALVHAGSVDDDILLDGEHLVEEALSSDLPIEIAAFSDTSFAGKLRILAAQVESLGVRTYTVGDAVFQAISPVQHPSGVVAIARRPATTLDAVLERAPQLLLLLDGVQDPGNVGAIIRAAEACGATGVIAAANCADPFGWKGLRGAMGSSFRLPVLARASLPATVPRLNAAGIRVFATVPRNGLAPASVNLRSGSAILLGGEGAGLPAELIAAADQELTIPMRPPVESLNVAIAAALVLYEASRQRINVTV